MIRIITGEKKGKKLETLEGDSTRPTSERIKEAIFSSIQFDLEGRKILDLFAGCGQMGLEALSRGSASVMFIDSSREAMEIVKKNIAATGYGDRTKTLVSDWRNYIRKAKDTARFDLVFIDPPYDLKCAAEALARLRDGGMLLPGAIAVLECGEEQVDFASFPDFEVMKSTSYGKKTSVHILLYRGAEANA